MNTLKLGWLILLVLALVAAGGSYNLYQEQTVKMDKNQANREEVEKLQEEQTHKVEWEADKAKDIETLRELAKSQGKWWFLHDIEEEMGTEFVPYFRIIGELKVEDQQDYIYISRNLEVEASYAELIRLFENLERELGFSIENLKITSGTARGDKDRHLATFVLSSLEIKKRFLDELLNIKQESKQVKLTMASLLLTPPWTADQTLALKIDTVDPFIKQDALAMFTVPTGTNKETEMGMPAILPPIDLSPRFRLEGIIKFPNTYVAIIGPDYIMQEGDWLENMLVEDIDARRVTLKEGEQEYFLAIPGFGIQDSGITIGGIPKETLGEQPEFPEFMEQLDAH